MHWRFFARRPAVKKVLFLQQAHHEQSSRSRLSRGGLRWAACSVVELEPTPTHYNTMSDRRLPDIVVASVTTARRLAVVQVSAPSLAHEDQNEYRRRDSFWVGAFHTFFPVGNFVYRQRVGAVAKKQTRRRRCVCSIVTVQLLLILRRRNLFARR